MKCEGYKSGEISKRIKLQSKSSRDNPFFPPAGAFLNFSATRAFDLGRLKFHRV